jgi:hypothetical protein
LLLSPPDYNTVVEIKNEQTHHNVFWEAKKAEKGCMVISGGSVLFLVKMVPGMWRMGLSLDFYITIK